MQGCPFCLQHQASCSRLTVGRGPAGVLVIMMYYKV